MSHHKTFNNRRSFLKSSAFAGGGLMLSFSWLNSFGTESKGKLEIPNDWTELNGFLKISENGIVSIYVAKPGRRTKRENFNAYDRCLRT